VKYLGNTVINKYITCLSGEVDATCRTTGVATKWVETF